MDIRRRTAISQSGGEKALKSLCNLHNIYSASQYYLGEWLSIKERCGLYKLSLVSIREHRESEDSLLSFHCF
jgi:hypothetical protein